MVHYLPFTSPNTRHGGCGMSKNKKAIDETFEALLKKPADARGQGQKRLPGVGGGKLPPSLPVMMDVREMAPELLAEAGGSAGAIVQAGAADSVVPAKEV